MCDQTRLIAAIANCAMPEPDDGNGIAQWDRGFNSGIRAAIQAVRGELEVAAYAKSLGVERVAAFADVAYESHPSIDADDLG